MNEKRLKKMLAEDDSLLTMSMNPSRMGYLLNQPTLPFPSGMPGRESGLNSKATKSVETSQNVSQSNFGDSSSGYPIFKNAQEVQNFITNELSLANSVDINRPTLFATVIKKDKLRLSHVFSKELSTYTKPTMAQTSREEFTHQETPDRDVRGVFQGYHRNAQSMDIGGYVPS